MKTRHGSAGPDADAGSADVLAGGVSVQADDVHIRILSIEEAVAVVVHAIADLGRGGRRVAGLPASVGPRYHAGLEAHADAVLVLHLARTQLALLVAGTGLALPGALPGRAEEAVGAAALLLFHAGAVPSVPGRARRVGAVLGAVPAAPGPVRVLDALIRGPEAIHVRGAGQAEVSGGEWQAGLAVGGVIARVTRCDHAERKPVLGLAFHRGRGGLGRAGDAAAAAVAQGLVIDQERGIQPRYLRGELLVDRAVTVVVQSVAELGEGLRRCAEGALRTQADDLPGAGAVLVGDLAR